MALCLSNFTSSFKACSCSLIFNSFCFCFSFSSLIFSCLSFSNFSNFNLLASSFLVSLYSKIVSAILSKKAWIYFSMLKLILKFIWGFKEFWKFIILKIKFRFLAIFLFLIFFVFFFYSGLNFWFYFFYFFFDKSRVFSNFFLNSCSSSSFSVAYVRPARGCRRENEEEEEEEGEEEEE